MLREVERARVLKTLRWVAGGCLFWIVSDFRAGQLGWSTVLASALTTLCVVLVAAGFAYVEILDKRERVDSAEASEQRGRDELASEGGDDSRRDGVSG